MLKKTKKAAGLKGAGKLFLLLAMVFSAMTSVRADNPPPVQTFYVPMPEDDYLDMLKLIEAGGTAEAFKPVDPMYTYITISVFSDNTIIYYDHWENGFDASINNPLNIYHPVDNPGGTQIWGDGDPSNGIPPGFVDDILDFGTVIRLENSVVSTNRTVINFDGGDKIAATKPIAVTWAGWATGSATLFAGALEVFDTTFWGTEYISPVGTNIFADIPTAVGEMFQYTGLSIMAGAGGATIQIDANADGIFETTNTLAEGEAYLVAGNVNVGGRVISDRPVQVDLLTGDIRDGYESRFFRLLPVNLWTSSSTTPVSTPETVGGTPSATTVWLYNPATNSISVDYVIRSGANLVTTPLTVPGGVSGGYLQQVIPDGTGARFINTNDLPFYALATIDSNGTTLSTTGYGQNRTWDWGYTLVPEGSLTKQVLVGLGIGRDPTSGTNPDENGAPIWVTPIGNGNSNVTVYVDYDSDPSTGPFTDPNGNQYDAAYTGRELDQLKIYRTNSTDQSGLLIYLLDDDVKLAAAWGADPLTTTAGAPGLDMGTGIPPLPQFVANKRSFLLFDEDGDGYISPGDVLEYRIVIDNTGRQPVVDLVAQDVLPDSLTYVTNTTFFINSSGITNSIADNAFPADPFPLSGAGYTITNESALPVSKTWQIGYQTRVVDFTNLPPGVIDVANSAIVGGVGLVSSNTVSTPLYSRIGDYVWWDLDGDGLQTAGETGINGITVNLLTTNGVPVLDEIGSPITAVTINDTFGNPGWYRLNGVIGGDYIVEFVLPDGYVFTTYNADGQGVGGTTNSTAQIPSGWTVPFTIAAGETLTTIDAGLVEASTIGDFVWLDVNGDGIQDPGEPGLNGVTVNLLDDSGDPVLGPGNVPITTVTTNDSFGNPGYYNFGNLYAGDYIVEFVLPADYAFTAQNADGQGLAGGANSDADTVTGRSGVINLGVAENLTAVDAGLLQGDLVLSKTVSQPAIGEGGTLFYSVSVSNAGPTIVTGIMVSEPLTNGLIYVANMVSQGSYNSVSGEWTLGTLAVGSVATLEIEATVDGGTIGTYITNTAQVTSADMPDPDPDNNEDSAVIYVSALNITKTSDVAVSVKPGGIITYTIAVSNQGVVAHADVEITDVVPAGTTYVPDSLLASLNPVPVSPGSTSVIYNTSSTFVVPADVTNVTVEAWGGGGGGGGRSNADSGGAGGGGGGAYARGSVTVTPGATNTVTVGTGGAGAPAGNNNGSAGGDSFFGLSVVLAKGGTGGTGGASGGGGAGGTAAASIGTTKFNGGNGAAGTGNDSGGGGGGAGDANPGGNAAGLTGGTGGVTGGGNGADGRNTNGIGLNGNVLGGGGSGGRRNAGGNRSGGAGANGRVIVTYDLPPVVGTSDAPPTLASGWTLDPGQTLTITFQVDVDDPLDLMAITNTATVTSDLLPLPVPATVVDEVIPVDLGIGKAASLSVVNEGSNVVFTLSLTNFNASITATGVAVTDVIPSGFDFVSANSSVGSYNSTSGVWTVGSLAAQAVATLELNVTAAAGSGGLFWTNTTTISASDFADTNLVNNTAQAVVLVRGADLALTKTVNNPAPNEETEVTYTITVENLGPSDTTGVTVLEPLTNGITYVSHNSSQGTYSTNTGVWTVGALTNGQIETLSITVAVNTGTIGTTITNRAQITNSDLPDPNPANDEDTAVLSVSGLRVTKVSDVVDFAYPGSNITYTIVVTNMGATAHTGVQVTDVLPAGTTYVPGSVMVTGVPSVTNTVRDEFNAIAYTNNNGTVNWANDWQEFGESNGANANAVRVQNNWGSAYQLRVYNASRGAWRQVDLSGATGATLSFDYRIVGFDGAGEASYLSVSTNGGSTWITLETWTDNVGATTSTNIDLTAYMSSNTAIAFTNAVVNEAGEGPQLDNIEIAFVSPGGNPGAPPNLASGITLPAGEAMTITFEVTVDDPSVLTQIVNTVSVTSDDQPVPVTDTVVDPVPYTDLGVVKSVDDSNPDEGDTVVYTIVLTNHGPADTTGVLLADVLPAGVTYVTNTTSQGTFNSETGIWTVGALDSLASATLTITATVDSSTAGSSITNTATITGNDLSDPNPDNDEDDAVIQVIAVDIGVGKSVSPSVPFEKEQLVYTIAVTNFGPDTATGVVVTDQLPAPLTYVSHVASQGSYVSASGLWAIGTMTPMQVETLSLTAYVPVGTSGTSITNTATVTAVDQVDTNVLNDTASVVVEPEEPPLLIDKTSNATPVFGPGDTISYTIVVTNQSSQTQTGIDLSDALPTGVSFVSDSVNIFGPVNTNATFLDRFDAIAYTNNNGTLNWTGNWIESEGDGPSAGDTRVTTDSGRGPSTLRFGGGSRTLAREANLGSYTNATLSLIYRRDGLLDAADFVELQVSSSGTSGPWTTIATYSGPATDAAYSTSSFDITDYISTNTAIRFSSPAGNTPGNLVWFDDVQISVPVRADANVAGGAPPNLATGRTLDPGEAFTVTFDVTVDDPITVTQIVNTASAVSDQMLVPVTDTVVDLVNPQFLAAVGDRVWLDENADGVQDAGETGIPNVTVEILNFTGGVVRTTLTDLEGGYLVTGLAPGTYTVRVATNSLPAGLITNQTYDPDVTTNHQTSVTLSMGQVYRDADFGYNWTSVSNVFNSTGTGAIGDRVWIDASGDGVQDPGESGLAGVTVTLYYDANSNGVYDAVYATTTTDAVGNYIFRDLPAGAYVVEVTPPGGYTQTGDPDDFGTSAGAPDHKTTLPIILAPGDTFVNADFGYQPAASSDIRGTVYFDANEDENLDTGDGDYGIVGVTVALLDTNGLVIATTTTDNDGNYTFSGLPAGTYTVWVNDTGNLLGGLSQTEDQDVIRDSRHTVSVNGTTDVEGIDFGYHSESLVGVVGEPIGGGPGAGSNTIGGTIWEDRDADGIRAGSETNNGLAGVTVRLTDTNGNWVATTVTDADGNYEFTGLPDGTYVVRGTDTGNLLNGWWHSTGPDSGSDNNSQSAPYTVTVSGGQTNTTADFGYYYDGAALGNRVWNDEDGDGIQDAGEPGMSNVVVRLTIVYASGITNVVTTRSDTNGFYSFGNLLLDENHNGANNGSPTFILSVINPGGGYRHTVHNVDGVSAALNSEHPLGATGSVLQGQDTTSLLSNPEQESSNAWYDFGFTLQPTLAVISAVRARVEDGTAVISWEVSLEVETVGYYLERWAGNGWLRINETLLPSDPFTAAPYLYEQADAAVIPVGVHRYRIIEQDEQGRLLNYGPYDLELDGGEISYGIWAAGINWELADSSPDADPDGDGLTNFQEYLAGTAPLSANSVLRITRIERVPEGMRLTWSSQPGRTYAVEMSPAPGQPFQAVVVDIQSMPTESTTVVPVSGSGGFFRVIVK